MKQATFASLNFDAKKRRTRREVFLADMDKVAKSKGSDSVDS